MGGLGVFVMEFGIVHERISDCVNYGQDPRDSCFAEKEIQKSLKHPMAVELVDSAPSKKYSKQYGYNAITH